MQEIYYHSPEIFTPTMLDIIKDAKSRVFGDAKISFVPRPPGKNVIGFGVDSDIRTLSPKQIASMPSAVSALVEAFELYRDGKGLPNPVIHEVPKGEEWLYIEAIESHFNQPIVFDIENAPDGSLLSIAVTGGGRCAVFTSHFKHVAEALSKCYYVVAHNGKYDQRIVYNQYGILIPIWFDTMLARHVLHPSAQSHFGLKELAQWVLGLPDYEQDIKEFTGKKNDADYSRIPIPKLVEYNGWDVFATYHLYKRFLILVQDDPAFWYEMRAAAMLGDVERNGIRIDVPYVEKLYNLLEEEKQLQLARLPEGINYNSPKQVTELFASRGLNLKSTDEKTLTQVKGHDDIIEPLLEYRGITKQQNTYCKSYLERNVDGLLYPTFNIHGTSTGRLSSNNPNAQNIPRDPKIRDIFIARGPDRVIIETDYAQAEKRVQAILSGDEYFISLFQPGSEDYFDTQMPVAFSEEFSTVEDYLDLKKSSPAKAKELRTLLKTVEYGMDFGRGAPAIAAALKITVKKAEEIINRSLNAKPKFKRWREEIMAAAVDESKRDMLVAWTGQRFESEVVTARNYAAVQRSALSFLPQATVAGLCTEAAIRVNKILKKDYPEAYLIMLIHDAIYVDAPAKQADEIGAIVAREMTEVGREVFGDVVLFTAEPSYNYRWGNIK